MSAPSHGRETFASRLGMVVTMIGVAVGLGNVWRFPYMVGRFGGAAFVLVYVLAVAFSYMDSSGSWYDSWYSEDNSNTLPYAVRMELTLEPLEEGEPERIIRRVASIWCAAPPVDTSTTGTTGTVSGPTGLLGN